MRLVLILVIAGACKYTSPSLGDDVPGDDAGNEDPDAPVSVQRIVPSNHADTTPLDAADLPDLIMADIDGESSDTIWRIYTDTGLIERETTGDVFVPFRAPITGDDPATKLRFELPIGATYAVLYVARFAVQANVSFEGHGPRALIIIARDAIQITGEIDFSGGFVVPSQPSNTADFNRGGPGGGNGAINSGVDQPATGCGGDTTGVAGDGADKSGGGGGGGGVAGAKGGDKEPSNVGGVGGVECMGETLIPLVGGGGGGAANIQGNGGNGGGGGGALQLTSFVSISIDGIIDVGGKGGFQQQTNDEGGGGGGAGGGVLLEAPSVALMGSRLVANGGGGGSGRQLNDGAQGRLDPTPAPGGAGSGGLGADGRGGNGGAGTTAPTAGDDHDPGSGGGGAAFGAIRINIDPGMLTRVGAVITPTHTEGVVVRR